MLNNIQLMKRSRPGNSSQSARDWFDFVIDGRSLHEQTAAGDMIGCLGWGLADYESGIIGQLLGETASDLQGGRVMIYVCPECGDLGCGALTVSVVRVEGRIRWQRIRYENDCDPGATDINSYQTIGPFEFDVEQYCDAIRSVGRGAGA